MDPIVASRFARLDAELTKFVKFHSGMRQRDANWYTSMGRSVGGSEMAAILGCNPYSTIHDVVASKVALLRGIDNWGGGGPACWWGVLFEDVIAAYTEILLGGTIRGDEICVQRYPGHRNSPDGYIVARSARNSAVAAHGVCAECAALPARAPDAGSDSEYCLWTTDMCPTLAELPRIFLLEFKCPLSRQPARAVPAQYRPQIWSGLAVSPVAHAGLFIDAVFRKCALSALGPGPDYDTTYNRNSRSKPATAYECAAAWGLIGIYAPRANAPAWVQRGKKQATVAADALDSLLADCAAVDGATVAARLRAAYLDAGFIPVGCDSDGADSDGAVSAPVPPVLDLGSCESRTFDTVLNMFNSRVFTCKRLAPCLSDGRGLDLNSESAISLAIDSLKQDAPSHYELLGVLPWKLFHLVIEPVARKAGFMDEVLPIIAQVHARVDAALRSSDPDAYLRAERSASKKAAPAAVADATAADIQDMFGDFKFA